MKRLWILMLVLVLTLAGCLGVDDDGDDDERDNEASLDYSGAEPGRHSDTAQCNEDGQLTVTAAIDDGNFSVEVTGPDGMALHTASYSGTLDGETESLEGMAGDWTITVIREDSFDGTYGVLLGC